MKKKNGHTLTRVFLTVTVALVATVTGLMLVDYFLLDGERPPEVNAGALMVTATSAPTPADIPAGSVSAAITPDTMPVVDITPFAPVYNEPPPVLLATPAPALHTSGEADYAFYWFTDTQHYTDEYPETLRAMADWMHDNAERYNVKYTFFTGDAVHENNDEQWLRVDAAMQKIRRAVPLFALAGNHDVGTGNPNYTNFKAYLGPDAFKDDPYIQGWYNSGGGRCDTFEVDGTKYLFIGLGWKQGTSAGINWANKMLKKYNDHHAIFMTHDYLDSEGLLSDTGQKLYEQIVKPNSNVFMVLCGHRYNSIMLTTDINDTGDRSNYRTVYNIMMNYQALEDGGGGFLTLIRVYKRDKLITFDTYSPTLDQWYYYDPARNINKEKLTLPVTIFDE
ncbi:MAG: metallophosphoesterase [Clostridiales bacterium]|jgi:hypothetical protein|nr:metallophosphoesterase [Clostridiales bacterium]